MPSSNQREISHRTPQGEARSAQNACKHGFTASTFAIVRLVIFSGFPHGIPHLLVQRAAVAGLLSDSAFYVDGSVNGGNSGGPIIDISDGSVVGIVTQRRFPPI